MAERRMFTKKVTDSDAFIELPSSAQALYFHLNQGADDDGFNNQIQNAMFKSHSTTDDLKVLMMKNFIIRFESGVIVIKHWRLHNTLRKDRYTPTNFQEEFQLLGLKDNGSYTLNDVGCQMVANRLPQVSIGKNSIDKNIKENNKRKVFTKPSLDELQSYIDEKQLNVDAQTFFDYYESNGWMVGHNHMKDFKATLRRWSRTNQSKEQPKPNWLGKEIVKDVASDEELEEMNKLLEDFK